jgi:hypothetical protein
MNREQIEARKAELLQTQEQLKANLNAVAGALQDCDYWLAQMAAEELKAPEPQEGKQK